MDSGQIVKQTAVARPADSINFGQAREYISEAKSTFVGQAGRGFSTDPMRLKEKFTRPNINLGSMVSKDHMMTIAQVHDKNMSLNADRQNLGTINSE